MAICLLITGFSFFIEPEVQAPEISQSRLAGVATGIFMFMAAYSPTEGPVPFTYSAEAFPTYIRDIGMSFATATCWGFNFILSLTFPALLRSFGPQGAFGYYAAWNIFGLIYCYFLLPETKVFPSLSFEDQTSASLTVLPQNLTLEELDTVFDVGNRQHSKYYLDKLPWYFNKHVLRRDVNPVPPMCEFRDERPDNLSESSEKITRVES
jgi:hypothetical protein